ncbi:hypothetical protein [Nannocystis pusilla]|uniref:hypothetical protein n=1 Tax=Nannocystis pusilla TaxID=889268 RepID=UPI003BEFCC73
MHFDLLNLFRGLRHDFDLLAMLRGENHMEVLPEGHVAIVVIVRGTATISRPRADTQVGLHITPRRYEPVFLTTPGTYCVTARDHVVGIRVLRRAEGECV